MQHELHQCAVPGCYGKPIFMNLCASHSTRAAPARDADFEEAVRKAQETIRQKAGEMPEGLRPTQAKGLAQASNGIVEVAIGHDRRATDPKMSFKYPKYYKEIPAGVTELDIYLVCNIFQVQDYSGALHHAIKKLLLPGVRTGGKTRRDDIKEARDTLTRWLEINQ